MPPRSILRRPAPVVRHLLDPDVPFPGGYEDRVTIELPCMHVVDKDSGSNWYDICLSIRGGGDMAAIELPTRFDDFKTIPADLWRDFRTTTHESRLLGLMNADERFGVQTLLDVLVYFADNHDIAEAAWEDFVGQLEIAAVVSVAGWHSRAENSDQGPVEHANRLVFGIAFWASGQWPEMFPRPQWDEERGEEDGGEAQRVEVGGVGLE
ncbi:hypothetical protein GSI_03459 [Ganoderma sinense ZZ0214-1]|uniref:Uncharacterized protein n=1 Tax=Ganoderma sinense ZZ0214-1 TaxID=1077348 RepID=A0A2G8SLP9_9APHY|nr:hypothetical protein GSI_03459 [Ganoderma sinense ZZ0214-1]